LYALPALQHIPKHIPIVTHFHGPWALESLAEGQSRLSAKIKMAIELLVLRRSSRFVVLSQAFADLLCKEYGVNPDIIDVVPMGVDLDRFQPRDKAAARKRLGWPADKFIVFTARRLVQRVGLRELVEAARGLSDDANVWIAIAGRGPEQANLERQITELQLSQKVALLGFISEEQLALSYAAADLTVMPSQTLEGFGCVIAESLACGTPVMVTPVGGMPEYVRPLDKHLVSDGRDAGAISRTLAYLVDHKDALPSRDRCQSYAEETFSWTRVSQRLQTIFAQAGQH
jgi:glycosyltransferase involved in cell wall biosynthesis